MKKLLHTAVALLLCFAMVFCFAACAAEKEVAADAETSSSSKKPEEPAPTIIGEWKCEVDILQLLNASDDPAVSAVLLILGDEPLNVSVTLNFKEDRTADATVDLKPLVTAVQSFITKMEEQDIDIVDILFQTVDIEELLKEKLGEEAAELNIDEEAIRQMADSLITSIKEIDPEEIEPQTTSGKYRYEDGKLYIIEQEGELSETEYFLCTLTADTFTITGIEYGEELPEDIEIPELNLQFKKVTAE